MCGLVLRPVMETPLSTWTSDQGTLRDGCQCWLLTACPALAAQPSTRAFVPPIPGVKPPGKSSEEQQECWPWRRCAAVHSNADMKGLHTHLVAPPVVTLLLHLQRRWKNTTGRSKLRFPLQAISWPRVLSHSLRSFWTWQVEGLDALLQQTRVTNVLAASKDPWMCWNCAKESRSGVQECNHLISHSWSVPTAQSKRNGSLWHVGGTCTTSSITQTTTGPEESHTPAFTEYKSLQEHPRSPKTPLMSVHLDPHLQPDHPLLAHCKSHEQWLSWCGHVGEENETIITNNNNNKASETIQKGDFIFITLEPGVSAPVQLWYTINQQTCHSVWKPRLQWH